MVSCKRLNVGDKRHLTSHRLARNRPFAVASTIRSRDGKPLSPRHRPRRVTICRQRSGMGPVSLRFGKSSRRSAATSSFAGSMTRSSQQSDSAQSCELARNAGGQEAARLLGRVHPPHRQGAEPMATGGPDRCEAQEQPLIRLASPEMSYLSSGAPRATFELTGVKSVARGHSHAQRQGP
jgi:hypothetical protein